MPKDGISMEERNDEWGKGCVVDGKRCFDCGDCCDDDPDMMVVPCRDCQDRGNTIEGRVCETCDGMGEL